MNTQSGDTSSSELSLAESTSSEDIPFSRSTTPASQANLRAPLQSVSTTSSNENVSMEAFKALQRKVARQEKTIDRLVRKLRKQKDSIDDIYRVYGDCIADLKRALDDRDVRTLHINGNIERNDDVRINTNAETGSNRTD